MNPVLGAVILLALGAWVLWNAYVDWRGGRASDVTSFRSDLAPISFWALIGARAVAGLALVALGVKMLLR